MPRPPSLLAGSLAPLISTLWALFLVWTALLATLWLTGDTWLTSLSNSGLRSALAFLVSSADPLWLLLASANLYLHLAETEGLARARVYTSLIASVSIALGFATAATGYPLGHVVYTTHLGPKFGSLPLGWPVLWFVIVLAAHGLATRLLPRASHPVLALATGCLALLTDANLEPIATKFRFYWFWYQPETRLPASASWLNYLTWFAVATGLAWTLRQQRLASAQRPTWRPALVLLIFNGLLILGHLRLIFPG